jgi:hypothetical protein
MIQLFEAGAVRAIAFRRQDAAHRTGISIRQPEPEERIFQRPSPSLRRVPPSPQNGDHKPQARARKDQRLNRGQQNYEYNKHGASIGGSRQNL